MSHLTLAVPPKNPARPGPGLVPETALRALDLTVRRRIESLLAGEHRAASLGIAMELAQVNTAKAKGRRALVNMSDSMELDGATPQDSPTAISRRVPAKCRAFVAKPVNTVMALQKAKPMATTLRRLHRSASEATGTPTRA